MALPEVNIALTTNLWTTHLVESYLTVTAHYVDEQWKLESKVL